MIGRSPSRTLAGLAMAAGLAGCALLEPPLYEAMGDADVALASRAVQRALETEPDGAVGRWADPASGHAGTVRPLRTFLTADGRVCRDYEETLAIDGRHASYRNTGCRAEDGSWSWL
jgi:surface antigen